MTAKEIKEAADNSKVVNIWGPPDMSIIDGGRRQPPKLPLECFGPWADWIVATAESCSAPPDYVAAALLSSASGVLGNARWVSPWAGWAEPPVLWMAGIGNPSSGKSPAFRTILGPLRQIEDEIGAGFSDTTLEYERDREAAVIKRENWHSDLKEALKIGAAPPDIPPEAVDPEKPVQPRMVVADTTVEQLAKMLSAHPRGLTLHRDELSGWLGAMDKYSVGDRGFWVEAYGGGSYKVDRVTYGNEPIRVDHATIAAFGGIQPDRLDTLLMKGDDDGLAGRFLMVWPNPVPPMRPKNIPDEITLVTAFRRLAGLVMHPDPDGKPEPSLVPMADDAADLFQQWRLANVAKETEGSGLYISHVGKLPGMVARLALVLEFLGWSLGQEPEPQAVSLVSVGMAAHLVDEYFAPMALRAYGDASLPEAERHASAIARRILREQPREINARVVRRQWRLPGLREAGAVRKAFDVLVDIEWFRPIPAREGGSVGRPRADYLVNPRLLEPSK